MPTVLTRPLSFTVVSADQAATAPAINAGDDRPGMVWRATGLTSNIIIDMGAGASYDCVALIGTSLAANDTVRIRTGTTNTGVGTTDVSIAAWTGTKPTGFTSKTIYYFTSTRTERYLRIDLTTAAIAEVQRLVVGPSITTKGIDTDAEFTLLDTSNIDTNLGADTIEAGLKKPRWKVSMSAITGAEWRSGWIGFLASVGKSTPILINPFQETPATYQSDAIFGRIRNDAGGKIPGLDFRIVELTIEGLSL